jgi:hypothetical protein
MYEIRLLIELRCKVALHFGWSRIEFYDITVCVNEKRGGKSFDTKLAAQGSIEETMIRYQVEDLVWPWQVQQ